MNIFLFHLINRKNIILNKQKKAIGFELNFCWGFVYSYNDIVFYEKPTEKMINWFEMKLMISTSYELKERERIFLF